MAVQGLLAKFAPHKDGGGAVTLVLDDLQWDTFIRWIPTLHSTYALARIHDSIEEAG
jgi:hypothetical protein